MKGDRSIEFSLRHSLGLVSYVIGAISLPHERYFHTLAEGRGLHYPGFSDDPIDGFRHLARDLEEFGSDFTNGDASIFRNLARELDPPGRLP